MSDDINHGFKIQISDLGIGSIEELNRMLDDARVIAQAKASRSVKRGSVFGPRYHPTGAAAYIADPGEFNGLSEAKTQQIVDAINSRYGSKILGKDVNPEEIKQLVKQTVLDILGAI